MSARMMIRLALKYRQQGLELERQYLEQCELEARQGYRPSSCIHGTNQWTDYDNICGPCESDWRPPSDYSVCLEQARADFAERDRRLELVLPICSESSIPGEIRAQLAEWTVEPVKRLLPVPIH